MGLRVMGHLHAGGGVRRERGKHAGAAHPAHAAGSDPQAGVLPVRVVAGDGRRRGLGDEEVERHVHQPERDHRELGAMREPGAVPRDQRDDQQQRGDQAQPGERP
ncbi:hypothetical protein [Nonomuraea salmonea]|uniref:hypothetical protein n=1 Tax=Nonomuraea salmonea TaxID=46181 RepID=UPI002FEBB6E5